MAHLLVLKSFQQVIYNMLKHSPGNARHPRDILKRYQCPKEGRFYAIRSRDVAKEILPKYVLDGKLLGCPLGCSKELH